jgi:broad specificity phosphatase PhoE
VPTILWARHGQNVANLTRTLSHRVVDLDLTATGERQARQLASALAALPGPAVGQIVCSPLRRARQTAEIVAAALQVPIRAELDDLREVNVGRLDGRSDAGAWRAYDAVLAAWRRGDYAARFPGGEDCRELSARLGRALEVALAGPPALIVAHGASLRAALPLLAGCRDPGTDLPVGGFATLRASTDDGGGLTVRVESWPGEPR